MPTIIGAGTPQTDILKAIRDALDVIAASVDERTDTLERIQQQLAMINEGENLALTERHYGSS